MKDEANATEQNNDHVDTHLSGPEAAARGLEFFESYLRNQIVGELAKHLETSEAEVDLDTNLLALGLDSLVLFTMTARLAEWMEQDIPAILLFEVDSINGLIRKMSELTDLREASE